MTIEKLTLRQMLVDAALMMAIVTSIDPERCKRPNPFSKEEAPLLAPFTINFMDLTDKTYFNASDIAKDITQEEIQEAIERLTRYEINLTYRPSVVIG